LNRGVVMQTTSSQSNALLARCRRLLYDHRSRAKREGQALDYGLADLRHLIESSPCCRWCKLPVGYDLQLDHLHPVHRGGRHALYNLTGSCKRCNTLRGMLPEAETLHLLELLADLHPTARADVERRLLHGGARYSRRKENG